MNQLVNIGARVSGLFAATLVAGTVFAGHAADSKTIIYVDLDANTRKAHSQLQSLKQLDLLGVNLKQHWAEVAVTKEEFAQLQKLNLSIRKAGNQLANSVAVPDGYLNPEQVVQALKTISTQYPAITKLFELGKTHQQRSMMAIEISAHVDDTSKPVILFNAMHHAREVMTSEIVMHIAKVLTENYGKDPEVTNWLDQYRIVLVPQVNPDGNALVSNGETMWRKNAYEYRGEVVGVDINRNYPAYWNYCNGSNSSPYGEAYRGPSAASEPETQAMMNLVNAYKPVAEISYHSYSEMILYPFGCSSVKNPSKTLFHSIGQDMNAQIRNDNNRTNSYEVGTVPELLYEADGGDIDWLWKEQGVFAFVIEVNASDFHPDYKKWRNVTVERQEGGWKAMLRRMTKSGFRAHIQTDAPSEISYSLKKIEGNQKIAFDADEPTRTFSLRSSSGLLYQLTEKGKYEVTFFVKNQPVKSLTVNVGETLVDLGDITI
jgi:murein tripeptide amidase MpaA